MVKVTKLRAIRAEIGLSVQELAEISGISSSTIFRYESGEDRITRQKAKKLCDALGLDYQIDLEEIVEIDGRWLHGNSHTFS